MRPIDGDALKESLKESRDNCSLWLQDCKEARSQKWIGRAEQALMTFNECIMRINTIPTIEPERKTGKWIRITKGAIPEKYICPFCHREVENYGVEELLPIRYPFCHCGADMRGEQDG